MNPAVKSRDTSNLPWIGPVPGDIAEVEAYCRIFRSAERLNGAFMETLCNPVTGECRVPYDFSPEEKPLLEDKKVSILPGRETSISSFSLDDVRVAEDTLPPLAVFRGEMKRSLRMSATTQDFHAAIHFDLELSQALSQTRSGSHSLM
ncbi:hypothetical protein Bca52824_006946 [Brassica carinata]|uniref:Uncharacterized protein n=1 Tax=Brassica carinata TaxID=52824 RepID=A0A8X8B7E4_BRACI|nr:hypothetical protein Bca52824_006946 [Brassica carinata]